MGFGVHVGNFSAVPFAALESLVADAELWNHTRMRFESAIANVTFSNTREAGLAARHE